MDIFPPFAQCLVPRIFRAMVLYLLWVLEKPKLMEAKMIPNIPFLHLTVIIRVLTHPPWVFSKCHNCFCLSFFSLFEDL